MSTNKKNPKLSIVFFSSNRADFGLLKDLILEIKKDNFFQLKFIATGSHSLEKFGKTQNEILTSSIKIDEQIEILQASDTETGNATSTALGIIRFTDCLKRIKPDLVVLLGDRFEIFSAGIAATFLRLPIAHLHGGELTEGSFDEYFRHSLTKLSHLHFVSHESYRNRVIQLGERPEFVFNVGSLGAYAAKKIKLFSKKKIQEILKINFLRKNIIITYHPVTLENYTNNDFFELIKAIRKFPDICFIFTAPNPDSGFSEINNIIKNECSDFKNRYFIKSLGQINYLSCLKHVDGILGNSSSGILEVSSFKKGTINIGPRQDGRIRPDNVIDCELNSSKIIKSINMLYSSKFQQKLKNIENPYYKNNTIKMIISLIKKKYKDINIKKKFFNIDLN